MATTVMTTRHLNTVGTLADTLAEKKLKLNPILLELTERFSPLKAGGCENSFALLRNSNLSVLRRTVAHVTIRENDVKKGNTGPEEKLHSVVGATSRRWVVQ
ncbi:MAG: hypothetical protein ACREP3_05755 [Candidatus Binatia bacterium]